MDQYVKSLLGKPEDLSSNLQNCQYSAVTQVLGDRDEKISGTHWLTLLTQMISSRFCEKPCLEN